MSILPLTSKKIYLYINIVLWLTKSHKNCWLDRRPAVIEDLNKDFKSDRKLFLTDPISKQINLSLTEVKSTAEKAELVASINEFWEHS